MRTLAENATNLRTFMLLTLFFLIAVFAQQSTAQTRGYQSRACGFDLDDDGVIGEAADCAICDASVSGGIVQPDGTDDPDGDGINEDILYVDCDSGTNSGSCGPEGQTPCLTIAQAITNADGAGDGAEDIICFTGTCTATPGITYSNLGSGVAGARTKTAAGSEEIDFQFPTNPHMIIGWDTDADGDFPPNDADDTSILDGQDANAYCMTATGATSRTELAHFSCTDWGPGSGSANSGGITPGGSSTDSSHVYLHDIEMTNINDTQTWAAGTPYAVRIGSGGDRNYYAFLNMQWRNVGGFWIRGSCTNSNSCGPIRWQNITYTALGAPTGATVMMDIWENFGTAAEPIEFLDSSFDGNIENWTPGSGSACGGGNNAPPEGFNPEAGAQSVVIRNNVFRNICTLLQVEDAGNVVNNREMEGFIVDRNEWVIDSAASGWGGRIGIRLEDGSDDAEADNEFFNGATITNNIFRVETDNASRCCIDITAHDENVGSVTPDGTVTIAHNTFDVIPSSGPIIDIHPSGPSHVMNYVIANNIFHNTGAFPNIRTNWPDNGVTFTTDGNLFDPAGHFVFDGGSTLSTLASWQSTLDTCSNHTCIGGDDNSTEDCTPLFVNPAVGDFHLLDTDTCAMDQGTDVSAITNIDIDGDSRPQGAGWDIGADEFCDDEALCQPESNTNPPGVEKGGNSPATTNDQGGCAVNRTPPISLLAFLLFLLLAAYRRRQIGAGFPILLRGARMIDRRKENISLILVLLAVACGTSSCAGCNQIDDFILPSGPRGYQQRICGYDLNGNGISGEEVDCQICRTDTIVDVDENGVDDVQRYVDADSGDDSSGNGSSASPWKTIEKAFAYFADNPPAAEQITAVCFIGRAEEANLVIPTSGAPGSFTAGEGDYEFEYPRYPFVLSGWDIDNDGEYYPVDEDDLSDEGNPPVMDGSNATGETVLALENSNEEDYVMLSHFRAEHYGVDPNSYSAGFFAPAKIGSDYATHLHLHDLVLADINSELMDAPRGGSSRQVFNHFVPGVQFEAIENIFLNGWSGYILRGSASLESGPIMLRNITARAKAPDGSTALGIACQKLWAKHRDIRYLDNYFDINIRHCEGGDTPGFMCDSDNDCSGGACVGEWRPGQGSKAMYCLGAIDGVQDVLIRNNEIRGFKMAISFQPDAVGYGPFPDIGPTVVDRNLIHVDTYWGQCSNDSSNAGQTCGVEGTVECPGGYCLILGGGIQFSETNDICSENTHLRCGVTDCGGATPCAPDCNGGADGYCHSTMIRDVTITNNVISSPQRLNSCLIDRSGSANVQPTSTFTIVGNTCYAPNGSPWQYAPWLFDSTQPYVTENIIFKNNISSFPEGDATHLIVTPARSGWQSDGNAYSPESNWSYAGTAYATLEEWTSATGQDSSSSICLADFVDPANFDFHLSPSDSCALDKGIDPSAGITWDLDGDTRPQGGGWDIGADEL